MRNKELVMYIFTDGSALNNGRRNCRAAWSVFVADGDPRNANGVVDAHPSNQIAELMAIEHALEIIENAKPADEYIVVTDSRYAFKCLTDWYALWERNGYLTKSGTPVKHAETIQTCVSKMKSIRKTRILNFMHMRSHQPKPKTYNDNFQIFLWHGNNCADILAKQALM